MVNVRSPFIAVLMLTVLFGGSRSGHGQSEPLSTERPKSEQADVAGLIDQLKSKRRKPSDRARGALATEESVWTAVDALMEMQDRAFPELISHFDDSRYSYSERSPVTDEIYHRSVGYLCREIVRRQVTKYVPWITRDSRGTPGTGKSAIPITKQEAQVWWSENQDKPLWVLQVESIRRAIAENRVRLEAEEDARRIELCKDAILSNEKLAESLIATETALPTKPFRPYSGR
jgi:hypothetical protein